MFSELIQKYLEKKSTAQLSTKFLSTKSSSDTGGGNTILEPGPALHLVAVILLDQVPDEAVVGVQRLCHVVGEGGPQRCAGLDVNHAAIASLSTGENARLDISDEKCEQGCTGGEDPPPTGFPGCPGYGWGALPDTSQQPLSCALSKPTLLVTAKRYEEVCKDLRRMVRLGGTEAKKTVWGGGGGKSQHGFNQEQNPVPAHYTKKNPQKGCQKMTVW